jgi:HlyD family secretion protein
MKRSAKPILYGLAVLAAIVGAVFFAGRLRGDNTAQKTQYKLTPVERATVKKTVSATGTLQPWTIVDIKSKAGGRVDALLVDVGSEVKKGQVLARIDPSDTLLSYNTAQADMDSAGARASQNTQTYQLQVRQSRIAINTARAQLASAVASRNAARARLQSARDNSRRSRGKRARRFGRLSQPANGHRAAPNARRDAAAGARSGTIRRGSSRANFENETADLKRQQSLLAKGFVAQSVVDQAQAGTRVAQAQLNSVRERLRTLAAEQRAAVRAADSRVNQARAALENARAQTVDVQTRRNSVQETQAALQQAEAQVASAQAALERSIAEQANNEIRRQDIVSANAGIARSKATIENAKTTLDQTTVRAPSEGVVLQKYVEQGTIITSGMSLSSTGTSILQLGDTTRMYINVAVDETDIANVDDGQAVEVNIEAYPGIPFEGKVARVDPQAKVEQNVTTVNVRVEIDNSSPTYRLLKPGMNATCEFIIDQKNDVIAVPTEAVRSDEQGSFVEIGSGGKPAPGDPKSGTPPDPEALIDVKLKRQPVEVGLEGNESVEITSGLNEGDKVVTQTIEPAAPTAGGSPFGGGGGPGGGRGGFGGGGGGGRR